MKKVIGFVLAIIVSSNLLSQTSDSGKSFFDNHSLGFVYSGWYSGEPSFSNSYTTELSYFSGSTLTLTNVKGSINAIDNALSRKYGFSFYRLISERIIIGGTFSYGFFEVETPAGISVINDSEYVELSQKQLGTANLFEIMPSFRYTIPNARTDKFFRFSAMLNIGYIVYLLPKLDIDYSDINGPNFGGIKIEVAPVFTIGNSDEISVEIYPSWNISFVENADNSGYLGLNVGLFF